MNDPHVVALVYSVEHGTTVYYEGACPLTRDTPEFQLTVDNNTARFALKNHYADEDEAREVLESFIQRWELKVWVDRGPDQFSLRFERSEIIDRDPPPSPPGILEIGGASPIRFQLASIEASGGVALSSQYPEPPSGAMVDPDNPDVKSMYDRYMNYHSGGEFLPSMAYFCLTVLEYKLKPSPRKKAAKKYGIHEDVLSTIGYLSAKGGPEGRKADTDSLTERERRWLNECMRRVIYRAAEEAAAGQGQSFHQITMTDLPCL